MSRLAVGALVTVIGEKAPIAVENAAQLEDALRLASDEAKVRGVLGAIVIRSPNKNSMTMVVGGSETVLSFDFADRNPHQPMMTCYLNFAHHTPY